MVDLQRFSNVMRELHELVSSEPDLAAFVQDMADVRSQAEALARGHTGVARLAPLVDVAFPTQRLAERVAGILALVEPLDGDEEPAVARAYAVINANLGMGIVQKLMRDFPHIIAGRGRCL